MPRLDDAKLSLTPLRTILRVLCARTTVSKFRKCRGNLEGRKCCPTGGKPENDGLRCAASPSSFLHLQAGIHAVDARRDREMQIGLFRVGVTGGCYRCGSDFVNPVDLFRFGCGVVAGGKPSATARRQTRRRPRPMHYSPFRSQPQESPRERPNETGGEGVKD